MPADPSEEARGIGTMCWFSSIVHPSYQRVNRPERFAEGESGARRGQRKRTEIILGQLPGNRLHVPGKRVDHGQ